MGREDMSGITTTTSSSSSSSSSSMMMKKKSCGDEAGSNIEDPVVLMEGSDMLMGLVGIKEDVFNNFVEHKFQQLDKDHDGKLSVNELEPADVANIGASLIGGGGGDHRYLPASVQSPSPNNDHIYTKILNEFTNTTTSNITSHGKQADHEVIMNKTEFKEVLSDILLLSMATAGNNLKHPDPIVVILRMDGEDLLDFINSPRFEPEMMSIFTRINCCGGTLTLRDYLTMALQQLTVDHGMPPSSDSWVMSNIIEPALELCAKFDDQQSPPIISNDHDHLGISIFLQEFKRVAERLVQHLKEQPVIVAHTLKTFNGSGINKLLSNNSDLNKALDMAIKELPQKYRNQKLSKDHLLALLNALAGKVGLPTYGVVDQVDKVMEAVVLKMVKMKAANKEKVIEDEEAEMKMLMREILGSIMLELQAKPISFSSNSVIHGPSMIT